VSVDFQAAGEQGILLQPVGSHDTDPFAAQDPVFTRPEIGPTDKAMKLNE